MATVNPYKEIIKQIEQKSQLDEQKANTTALQGNQQAYIGYMNAKRDLGDTLASQGIMGGGSESAALGASVGYQRQQNVVAGNRGNEISAIRQNALANKTSTQSQSAQWENDQQQLEEQRFANTVKGYDTIPKVDNAIAAAKEAGETYKVQYLLLQRAALVEQAKDDAEEAAARASYSSGSSGGSSSTQAPTQTVQKTATAQPTNGYTSDAPLALSVPRTVRPMVANYYDPQTYSKPASTTIRKNPYYR